MEILDKIVSIKILRPITLTIIGVLFIIYTMIVYVFGLEKYK
jgi:hypothetical protein